jgi:PmbA protein
MSELLALAEQVVARAQSGEQVEAYVSRGTETSVRVYEGAVEQFTSAQSEGIGVRVIRDGRTGFAYAGTLDARVIDEVLADARDNVQFGTPDEYAALASPDGVAKSPLVLWDERLASFGTDDKVRLAIDLDRMTRSGDSRIRVESADYSDGAGEAAVATSTGIRASGRENGCYVSVSTLADDNGETMTGFGFAVGRDPASLDLDRAAREAVERATRLLGAGKPTSRRTTVVLDPFVTAQFLGVISATVNGESVAKGRSLFRDRLGDTVASPLITLMDDPTDPRAYTATEVDGEGLAARRNLIVDNGVLNTFVHSSYSARRLGTTSTGNAVRGGFRGTPGCGCIAMQLVPGTRSAEEIIGDIDDGVLIQMVQGLHSGVNTVSGDFSTGASGLTIRNGSLAEPVREFTIASTLQRMLLDVAELGNDLEWLPMRATGLSMVIRDVTVSGS